MVRRGLLLSVLVAPSVGEQFSFRKYAEAFIAFLFVFWPIFCPIQSKSGFTRLFGLIFLVSTFFSPVILFTDSWASFSLQKKIIIKKSFDSFVWTRYEVNRAVLKAQTQAPTAQKPPHTWCSRSLGTSRTSYQAELSKKFCTFLKCQADHDEYKSPELRGSAEGASHTSLWRWSCSPSSTWPWSRHRTQTKAWRSGHWSPPSPLPWALGQRTEPGPES